LKKSKEKLYVKWKGYDDPSWIPEAELTSSWTDIKLNTHWVQKEHALSSK
jgi:hypothetical protein